MSPPPNTKERLVASAARLWHAKSYTDVGVSEICEESGVRKGSFYHFFPSKSDVALAVLESRREQAIECLFRPVFGSELAPLERLTQLIEVQYRLQKQIQADGEAVLGCPIGNLALELSTQDECMRERCVELLQEWAVQIEPLLESAVQEGELPPIDAGRAAMAVTAYIEGILLLVKTRNDAKVIRDLTTGVTQLVVALRCDDDNGDQENTMRLPQDALKPGHKWIALAVLCLAFFMDTLDVAIVNVTPPTIQEDLGFTQQNLA